MKSWWDHKTTSKHAWWDFRVTMHTLSPQGKLILIQMADTDPHAEEHTYRYRRPLISWTFHQTGKETWERSFFRRKKKTFLLFILEKKSRFLISDSFHLKWRRCCPSNLHIFFAIFQLKSYSWDRLMIWLWHIWVSYLCDVSPSQWLRYQSFYKDCYLAAELQIWLGDLQISGYSPWHKIPLENSCSNQAWIWYNEDKAIFFWHF